LAIITFVKVETPYVERIMSPHRLDVQGVEEEITCNSMWATLKLVSFVIAIDEKTSWMANHVFITMGIS
jgi:hypothetical protein